VRYAARPIGSLTFRVELEVAVAVAATDIASAELESRHAEPILLRMPPRNVRGQ
jgi:hypothetical protein